MCACRGTGFTVWLHNATACAMSFFSCLNVCVVLCVFLNYSWEQIPTVCPCFSMSYISATEKETMSDYDSQAASISFKLASTAVLPMAA